MGGLELWWFFLAAVVALGAYTAAWVWVDKRCLHKWQEKEIWRSLGWDYYTLFRSRCLFCGKQKVTKKKGWWYERAETRGSKPSGPTLVHPPTPTKSSAICCPRRL